MPTSKTQRLYSVATYDKRLAAAKAKGRELVAKRKGLIASRNKVANIIKLTTQRRKLVRDGAREELKKFDAKNGAYLGKTPRPLKDVESLHKKLLGRLNITRKSIENLRGRVSTLNEKRNQATARARARKSK